MSGFAGFGCFGFFFPPNGTPKYNQEKKSLLPEETSTFLNMQLLFILIKQAFPPSYNVFFSPQSQYSQSWMAMKKTMKNVAGRDSFEADL